MNDGRRTIRIFVSSPDDLGEERALAQDIIKRLAVEYQRHLLLDAVIWEETALSAAQDFQEGIPDPADCDIVVVMLWSKLGSVIQAPGYDGMTGTEWEFHDAIHRAEVDGKPVVLVYRKDAPKIGDLMNPEVIEQARRDREALERFFNEQIIARKRAYRLFDNKDRLAQMLEHHLRSELNKYRVSDLDGSWEGSPFRGLKSFEYEHRGIFFGRDQVKRQLLHQLAQQVESRVAFIMVSAMSGSGKSSLVKAGLLPMLETYKAIGDVVMAPWTIMRPNDAGDDPIEALAAAILRPKGMAAAATSDDIREDWVAEALRRSPGLLKPFIHSALNSMADVGEARLVLVVDQFEELFSNKRFSMAAREQFIAALDALARSGLVWVIGTMRSDFLHEVEAYPLLVTLMRGDGQFHLAYPREDELLQMIRDPARLAGLEFEQGIDTSLDRRLMEDANRDPGTLPLLEFTLDALYERREGRRLSFAAYEALGGIEGAVADRAERVFGALSQAAGDSFDVVFRALVTVDPETRGVSARRADRDRLKQSPGAGALIDAFVDGHLLVSDRGPDGGAVVWVAHESLLRAWPRLRTWVENNISDLHARSHLAQQANHWQREGRNNDFLLAEGRPFNEARDLLERLGAQLDPIERLYVERSRQHIRAGRRREVRRLGAVAVLLGLIVVAAFALSHATRNFQAGSLEKAMAKLDRGNVARAVFLAINSDLLPEGATRVLSRAFSNEYLLAMVNQRDEFEAGFEASDLGDGYQAGFSPDGRTVIATPRDGEASLWILDDDTPRFNGPVPLVGVDSRAQSTAPHLVAALFADGGRRVALLSAECLWLVPGERLAALPSESVPLLSAAPACTAKPPLSVLSLRDVVVDAGAALQAGRTTASEGSTAAGKDIARDRDGKALVRWSRDGRHMVIVQQYGHGKLRLLRVILGDGPAAVRAAGDLPGEVRDLELSPDGEWVAIATRSGSLCLGKTADGALDCREVTRGRPVNELVFDPTGKILAAVSADQLVRLFAVDGDLSTCIGVLGSAQRASRPGGAGSWYAPDQPWKCVSVGLRKPVHDGAIRAVAFSSDGHHLATGGDDRRVVLWTLKPGKVSHTLLGSHDQTVNAVLFSSHDGEERLVSTSIDHTARLWNPDTGELLMLFGHDGPVIDAGFVDSLSGTKGQGGEGLVTVAGDRTVRLWRTRPDKPIAYPLAGHRNHVWHVSFRSHDHGRDGDLANEHRLQLLTTSYDGMVRLWTLDIDPVVPGEDFRYLRERIHPPATVEIPAGVVKGRVDPVRYAAFANRSDRLVTATRGGRFGVWTLAGEPLCTMEIGGRGDPSAVLPMAGFGPDDRRLFTAQTGKGAQVWDLGACRDQAVLHCEVPHCQAFELAAGLSAAVSDADPVAGVWSLAVGLQDGRVQRLDPDRPTEVISADDSQRHGGKVVQLSFSPDHNRLLSASADGTAALWDANGVRRLQVYGGHGEGHTQGLYNARFDPEGRRIVTASQDGTAIVWDVAGPPLKHLIGHLDRVYHASFSPDGRWVLTASRDGTARLWDSEDRGDVLSAIVELRGNGSGISSAAFSPDGRYVATSYWDPGADLWDALSGTPFVDMSLTIGDYAERFGLLNRLDQWRVQSVPGELPWWKELALAIWGRLH
jgi:WD40 repeat protein